MAFSDAAQFSFFSRHSSSGALFANTFALYCHDATDPVTSTVLQDFLDSAYMDGLVTAYRAVLDTGSVLQSVTARRCFDPTDPTDPAPAAARTVDQAGTRSADQQISIGLCALLVGHSDTASRRARSHKFMPPAVDQDQAGTDTDWYTGGPYITNVRALRTELNKLLFTAGGSHAGGAAADLDLATYSLTARRQNQDNYLFRWSSIGSPSAYHYLRSRVPRG